MKGNQCTVFLRQIRSEKFLSVCREILKKILIHQSNILTCVCFKAVGAPIGAEGARFTGDVKSIENGSCRWRDATRDVAAVRRRSSRDWSRWFDGWDLKSVPGKSCYILSCKEETLVNFMATYLKAMYKYCAVPSATHHRRSRWRCAASP